MVFKIVIFPQVCAKDCKPYSQMISFGKCSDECACYCVTDATDSGCKEGEKDHYSNYDLYMINTPKPGMWDI